MDAIVLSKKMCQCTRLFTANLLTRWMHSGTDLTLNFWLWECAVVQPRFEWIGFYPKISMKWKQCLKCAQREHGSWCSQAGVWNIIGSSNLEHISFKFENFIIRLYSGPFVGRKWIWSNRNRESVFASLGWWRWSDLYWWRINLQQALISTFTTFIIRDQSINFAQCFTRTFRLIIEGVDIFNIQLI